MKTKLHISDLSIGDWIRKSDTKDSYKVAEILKGEIVRLEGNNHLQHVDNLEPIPLTQEIMEANGFECIAIGDKGASTPKQNYMRYEKWRGETQWGYRELFYDRMTHKWRFHGINEYPFDSIHKLQHAIRFSGWDKNISV